MTKILFAVATILAVPCLSSNAGHAQQTEPRQKVVVGQWAVAVGILSSTACGSLDDLSRFYTLFRSGDMMAATAFSSKHCTHIKVDTEVMVEDSSLIADALCVRPRGEPDCLWIKSVAIATKADVAKEKADAETVIDEMNEAFDKQHPECKGWRTNKNLPDYCY